MMWCVAVLTWLLVGCGGSGESAEVADEVDPDRVDPKAVELVFWYQHSREREQALQDLIGEFNRTNGHGITVNGEYSGSYGDIYNKMMTGLQGGTLPNLVVAYQNQALLYYEAEGLVDLNRYILSSRWGLTLEEREDYVASFVEQDRAADGAQIGLPPNRSLEILYYNADWLRELGHDAPPRTWEEFAHMCRQARDQPFSRRDPDSGRSLGFLYDWDASRLATMVFSRGGDIVVDGRYAFDNPHTREALELMQELIGDGAASMMSEPYADQGEFAVAAALFMIRSSSGLPFVRSAVEEDGLAFDWRVGPPPHAGAEPVMNVYGASISVCRASPEKELASWLFLKWFTAPAQQARWVKASNYFPVRHSAARELEAYFEEYPRYRAVFDLLPFGKSEPNLTGYQVVRRKVEQVVVEVAQGADIGDVLQKLDRDANATLGGY